MSETTASQTPLVEPMSPTSKRRSWLLPAFTVLLVIGAFAGTIYLLGDAERRNQVEALIQSPGGLLVLFVISAVSNATLILPVPGLALTVLAATVANPLIVGIVAGSGQTIGELTGYLAGYSGKGLIDNNPRYDRLTSWMRRFGPITIFVLAIIPNPVFDVAGIIAGALRMPLWQYLFAAGGGKIIKNVLIAYAATASIEWLLKLFGG